MRANRLEEVLEECVSAYLAGRRSVEDSLSLYPSLAAELAPLLRTAVGIADSFQSYSPPAYARINVRQRLLGEAAARAHARALTQTLAAPRVALWQRGRRGFLAAAAAVAIAAVVVGGTAIGLNGGGGDSLVRKETPTAAPITPVVSSLRQQVDLMALRARQGQPIETEAIQRLSDDTKSLSEIGGFQETDRPVLEKMIQDQYTLLQTLAETQPLAAQTEVVRNALGVTETTAGKLGIKLPVITPKPAASPAGPTIAPTGTPQASTPTPVATPEPSPTAVPEPSPTPAASAPTPTPSIRQPSGGQP